MSDEITTTLVYNPRLCFDSWAKHLIDLPPDKKEGYTKVEASLEINNSTFRKSWKINPIEQAMKDLVMACVTKYGDVLEGRHFYFDRRIKEEKNNTKFIVTLFVIES